MCSGTVGDRSEGLLGDLNENMLTAITDASRPVRKSVVCVCVCELFGRGSTSDCVILIKYDLVI